jgi:hypothetical protein
MGESITIGDGRWLWVFGKLSPQNRAFLKPYFSRLYPRKYVKRLLAAVIHNDVQSKESSVT